MYVTVPHLAAPVFAQITILCVLPAGVGVIGVIGTNQVHADETVVVLKAGAHVVTQQVVQILGIALILVGVITRLSFMIKADLVAQQIVMLHHQAEHGLIILIGMILMLI